MKVIDSLTSAKEQFSSVVTIGNFDGVHRGHLALLKRLREIAKKQSAKTAVVTFKNHPSEVLRPDKEAVPWITTFPHRLKLLEQAAVDLVVALTFTRELSMQTPFEFLKSIQQSVPFDHLLLGADAVIGRNRAGDSLAIRTIAKELHFSVEYHDLVAYQGEKVSSTAIREAIRLKDFAHAEKLLGRPYSILAPITTGQGKGKTIGFPTANIDLRNLVLPPLGVYAVTVDYQGKMLKGVANLGIAPTVRKDNKPILEVHFLDYGDNLYGKTVEVFFNAFIRPEKKFASIEDLKKQIASDIKTARSILT